HVQLGAPLPRKKSGNGSLNRSNMVDRSPLNVLATPCQNGTAEAASGIGFWQSALIGVASLVQAWSMLLYRASLQWRSRIATRPCACRVFTYVCTAEM